MQKLFKVSKTLYSDGCSFLIPYCLIYAAAWILKTPINFVQIIFITLHTLNIALLVIYFLNSKSANRFVFTFGIALVFTAFCINGVYLEYPADPWEYFKYIFSYNSLPNVHLDVYAPANLRFTYFFSWTLIGDLPIEWRRQGLTFIASFWQTLLALQIFLLSRRIGSDTRLAILQAFASVLFVGYANLNYFAYLALSSTLICFTFYFRGVIAMIDIATTNKIRPYLVGLAVSIIGIALSHTQGFILLIISALALGFYKWFSSRQFHPSKYQFIYYLVLSQTLLFFGWFYMMIRQRQWRLSTFEATDLPNILKMADIYSSSIGIHGLLNASLALLLLFRFPLLSILTLAPIFLVIFPPTLKAIRFIVPYSLVSHRILYALPACFFLVIALDWLAKKFLPKLKATQFFFVIFVLCLLAWPSQYPWQGRLQNLILRPPPELDLQILDPLAIWLEENRQVSQTQCLYQSDRVTINFLATHFKSGQIMSRTSTNSLWYNTSSSVPDYMNAPKYCGILSVHKEKLPHFPASLVNEIVRHWHPESVNMSLLYPDEHFLVLEEAATQNNWKRTEVPPFYVLYEAR